MLSVGGPSDRSRSKSPGRRRDDERSRSRDIRAPSPARRAPPPTAGPPPSRIRRVYDDDDEDEGEYIVSDGSDDRYRKDHSRAIEKVRPRGNEGPPFRRSRYSDEEDEEDGDSRTPSTYADTGRKEYARQGNLHSRSSGRDATSRGKDYAVPGQFEDEDDQPYNRKERDRYSQQANVHNRTPSTGTGSRVGYKSMPQYQYAQIDQSQLTYVNKPSQRQYTRTPSESGPSYIRNPQVYATAEPNRRRHTDRYEDTDDRYTNERHRGSGGRLEYEEGRAPVEERKKGQARVDKDREESIRRAKEREEFDVVEGKRREIDRARKERDEVEAELRQKKNQRTVTIQDERDHKRYDQRYNHSRKSGDRSERLYDEDSRSDESDSEERLRGLSYDRNREHNDSRYEKQYEPRRDGNRRDVPDDRYHKHGKDSRSREHDVRGNQAQVVEIHPSGRGILGAPASPGLSAPTHRLSVSGQSPGALTLALPGSGHSRRGSVSAAPGSPLLESYKGTYQTISPMPSPKALARHPEDSDLSDLDLDIPGTLKKYDDSDGFDSENVSDYSSSGRRPKSILKRRPELGGQYDPEDDAIALAAELKRSAPSADPLIKTLPTLRSENIALLRTEYKKHAKIQGKGINLAKHIKMKLGSTNVGKASYATALGRWESEAHWANFWYQSGSSRRELLIEALFGRTNAEIRAIKEAFSDKRYGDSLVKCMEAELKKDKFRLAVLKALEAKRGNEVDHIDGKLVRKDVSDLHKAVTSRDGGETALINVIVVRSDEHLRLVLREYEEEYEENFARSMIKKSQNLVGETLAHILNGVLNRPVRDALLLHQAIAETSKDRAELIISRLVRFHWEPKHLERVKIEYRRRYKTRLEQAIQEGTKGDFSTFCIGLCQGAVR